MPLMIKFEWDTDLVVMSPYYISRYPFERSAFILILLYLDVHDIANISYLD